MATPQENTWFSSRRNLLVKNVIRDFMSSCALFNQKKGSSFHDSADYDWLDRWIGNSSEKGPLWQLKDNCHLLWKDADPASQPSCFLFDWLVGATFHEAMKLKESTYLVSRYEPTFAKAMVGSHGIGDGTSKCQLFFQHTKEDIKAIIGRMECLFETAVEQLVEILRLERDNPILLRYLIESPDECDALWGDRGGADYLLSVMFPQGLDQAYCHAGESYLEGGWYAEARVAFEKALEINGNCSEARRGLEVLEKRLKELTTQMTFGANLHTEERPRC